MPKFFITGIVLFLLLGAGYGALQAARSIPWDCADWQAFAHDDRTTAILESLAENRGKTLYCGVDQSDTFAKAETWEAGKDRNERDDTIYQGERGRFRGFIAAQEGWLTEGESGVTGQPTARIFEFPKEERQRRRKPKYEYLRHPDVNVNTIWVWGLAGPRVQNSVESQANTAAQAAYPATDPSIAEIVSLVKSVETFRIQQGSNGNYYAYNRQYPGGLNEYCRRRGYEQAVNVDLYLLPRGSTGWHRIAGVREFPDLPGPQRGDYIRWVERTIRFNSFDCRREK